MALRKMPVLLLFAMFLLQLKSFAILWKKTHTHTKKLMIKFMNTDSAMRLVKYYSLCPCLREDCVRLKL